MTEMLATQSDVEIPLAEHEELDRRISNVRQLWFEVDRLGAGPNFAAMAAELTTLRPILVQHFEHEEANGFMGDVLAQAPWLSEGADVLLAQHRAFLADVDRMVARLTQSGEAYASWHAVSVDLEDFADRLHAHERAENELLESAWCDDIGVGD